VQFDYKKAVLIYLGAQGTFNELFYIMDLLNIAPHHNSAHPPPRILQGGGAIIKRHMKKNSLKGALQLLINR